MGYFQSSIDRAHMCKTKPAIDAIVAQVKPHRDAIAELRSVSKSAVTKAKNILATAKTAKQQAQQFALSNLKKLSRQQAAAGQGSSGMENIRLMFE